MQVLVLKCDLIRRTQESHMESIPAAFGQEVGYDAGIGG